MLAAYLEAVHLSLEVFVQSRVLENVRLATLWTLHCTASEETAATRVAEIVAAVCQVRLHERLRTDGTQVVIGWLHNEQNILTKRRHSLI